MNGRRMAKLSPENGAAFVSQMKREAVSASMIKQVVYTFRTILGTAVAARIIPADPTAESHFRSTPGRSREFSVPPRSARCWPR